jgi:hypothetical protein
MPKQWDSVQLKHKVTFSFFKKKYRTLNIIQAHLKYVITEIWFVVVLQQSSNFNIHIF